MNKEPRTGERRTGTRDEEPERGTRPGNEARETLRPHPNSVTKNWGTKNRNGGRGTGTGNEEPERGTRPGNEA